MSVVIGTLRIDLEAGTASFSEAMGKMERLSAKTANDVKRSLTTIATAGAAMVASIAGSTAAIVMGSHHAIIGLGNTAQAVGTTVESLSALQYASRRTSVPLEVTT